MPLYRKNCIDSVSMHNACSDPKRGSCILWNPTSFREAHENVFIRNDLPLMCRDLFPPPLCALGENKTVRGMRPQSGQYLHR